jgi:hypothetical protein
MKLYPKVKRGTTMHKVTEKKKESMTLTIEPPTIGKGHAFMQLNARRRIMPNRKLYSRKDKTWK